MRLTFTLLLCTALPTLRPVPPLHAQAQTESWTAFTSMRQINALTVHQGGIWSATAGGVLHFDLADETYRRFTRIDGLAGNNVISVAADAAGDLWFGTDGQGLSRFRTAADAFDPPILDFRDLRVGALAADGDRVFVGTPRGVSVFLIGRQEVKETYRLLGNLPKDIQVNALAVFGGRLWAGTAAGLAWALLDQPNLQDPDSWDSRRIDVVHDLLAADGELLVAALSSVWRFIPPDDPAGAGRLEQDFANPAITRLGLLDGEVVGATAAGEFFRRNGPGDWSRFPTPGLNSMQALSKSSEDLWVGTLDGLKAVGRAAPPPTREPAGNRFFGIDRLPNGEVWATSVPSDQFRPRLGLYQLQGERWTVYTEADGLPSDIAVTVEGDDDGQLWTGTWGKGAAVRDTSGRWNVLDEGNSVLRGLGGAGSFVVISDIERDPAGNLWLTNLQAGLAVFDGYPPQQSLLYPQSALGLAEGRDIRQITFGPDGLKWISTARDGFLLFDDGGTPFEAGDESAQVFDVDNTRLTSNRAEVILADERGVVWIGTDNGLNAMRGSYDAARRRYDLLEDAWTTYTATSFDAHRLPSNQINALAADAFGNIWVGTDKGLVQIGTNGDVVFTFTRDNSGLIDNRVVSLDFDAERGELWIGTLDGLSRLRVARSNNPEESAGLRVYPNPYAADGRQGLTFAGLPLGASLRLFAPDGSLVRTLSGVPGSASVAWDGQNAAGLIVGSGIYYFVVEDESGRLQRGKFAVVNGR